MAEVMVIGCGDVGSGLAAGLRGAGHGVVGVRRTPPAAPVAGVDYRRCDVTDRAAVAALPTAVDQVCVLLAPDRRAASDYRALYVDGLDHLIAHFTRAGARPHWLLVSSTSVYGQDGGEWVDEDSMAAPVAATARALREAEQRILAHGGANTVVRFAGIYGPGRERLLRAVAAGVPVQYDPPTYTNRIHRDDGVGVLLFLLERRLRGVPLAPLYVASDCEPATAGAVAHWIAAELGCPPPPPRTDTAAAGRNKRCSSARLRALGYRFRFPSFRDGYRPMIERLRTRGEAW